MAATRILLGFGLLAHLFAFVSASVAITGFYCTFSKDLTANGNCHLSTAKSGTAYLSAGVTFVRPLDDVWIRIKFLRKVNHNHEIFGVNYIQNFCDRSKGETLNYFIKRIFMMGIKQVKNLKCPLLGNVTLSKYRFVLPMVQGFMPPADYLLHFNLARAKQNLYILDGNISFSVTALV